MTSTTPSTQHLPLRIERLSDGGFVVSEAPGFDNSRYCGALFASSSIGEALAFIAGRLDPEGLVTLPAAGGLTGRLDPEATKVVQVHEAIKAAIKSGPIATNCDCSHCGLHKSRCKCPSRDFAKAREASANRPDPAAGCSICGYSGPFETARRRCGTCGRSVGIFENN